MVNRIRLTRRACCRAAILVATAAIFTATGCSHPMGAGTQNTITLDQSKQRASAYVQQVVAALPDKPRLEPIGGGITELGCGGSDESELRGRISADGSFFLRGIPAERNPGVYSFFRSYLTQQGFTVRTDQSDFLVMHNPKDSFSISLQESGDGSKGLSLGVSSPCVWPNGTPRRGDAAPLLTDVSS